MPEQPRDPMEWERRAFPLLRKIWLKIKSTTLFDKFRHSNLNPYHRNVPEIKAENLTEATKTARKIAIEKISNKDISSRREMCRQAKEACLTKGTDFIYNGTRYNVEESCSVQEEFERDGVVLRGRGNVADRIPRDKNGKLDLLAEDPLVIAIVPIEGPALIGHVCMQYQDIVVNRLIPSIHTDPLYPKYGKNAQYYFVYPSQLGINPKNLKREMEKHNIKYARRRYDLLFNNCARNVGNILKNLGVKDLDFYGPDKIGLVFTNPGNNPWGKGIQGWCLKHGVHVNLHEMETYHQKHNFENVTERRKEMDATTKRYKQYKNSQNPLFSLLHKKSRS
ncbi:MAG: hypothetical protein J6W11_06310 [Alphaproteobacteria bacterium]|nr:hypothetical protein [Alphaproteobacteria bacterium]